MLICKNLINYNSLVIPKTQDAYIVNNRRIMNQKLGDFNLLSIAHLR